MNRINIIFFIIFFFRLFDLSGQIGINTTNPSGMFNIKPNGDQVSDETKDLIITSDGLLGLGTDSPKARVHIVSKDKPAIRLIDGAERMGKILYSDEEGNAQWGVMRGTGGESYYFPKELNKTYPKGLLFNPFGENVRYDVSIPGNYLIFIRITGQTSGLTEVSGSTIPSTAIYFELRKSQTRVDAIKYHVPVGKTAFFNTTVILSAIDCSIGDTLEVLIKSIDGDLILRSDGNRSCKVNVFTM